MPVLPLSFHYCGVYFQSLCKKPRLKKGQVRKAYSLGKTDWQGSQESLISSIDETESTASTINTEVSADNSVLTDTSLAVTDTSGISSEGDNSKTSDKGSDSKLSSKGDNEVKDTDKKGENEKEGEKLSLESEIEQSVKDEMKKRDLSTNEIIAAMEQKQRNSHKRNLSKAKLFVIILVITNIPAAMYFSLIHQRGTVLVMKHIYDASLEKNVDVLFLMPCHSTPYYR